MSSMLRHLYYLNCWHGNFVWLQLLNLAVQRRTRCNLPVFQPCNIVIKLQSPPKLP